MNDFLTWIACVLSLGALLLASHGIAMWRSDRRERRYWKQRVMPFPKDESS